MVSSGPQHPSIPFATKRYELLTLGDELLLGLTPNGHLTFIGTQLGRRGVLLQRNVTITDEADAIARQFRESWAGADVIITTGGLGPTCDARTRGGLAGGPAPRRGSRRVALAGIGLSMAALVHDLGRPSRFLNMQRVVKPTSPMSVGTWVLSLYGPLVGLAATAEASGLLPGTLRGPARLLEIGRAQG